MKNIETHLHIQVMALVSNQMVNGEGNENRHWKVVRLKKFKCTHVRNGNPKTVAGCPLCVTLEMHRLWQSNCAEVAALPPLGFSSPCALAKHFI
jgi:hypothetical protein